MAVTRYSINDFTKQYELLRKKIEDDIYDIQSMPGAELWEDRGSEYMNMSPTARPLHFSAQEIAVLDLYATKYRKDQTRIAQEKKEQERREFERKLLESGGGTLDDEASSAAYNCSLEECERMFKAAFGGRWIAASTLVPFSAHWYMMQRLRNEFCFESRSVGDPTTMTFSTYFRLKGT